MFFDQREPSQRQNNNTKTTFSFSDPQKKQKYDYGTQAVRQRQFEDQPLQPGATRQSYQDSDIFGTKQGTELVQKSAIVQKQIKQRDNATFAKSGVLGNDQANGKTYGVGSTVSRDEKNWGSTVFAGPKTEQSKRTRLNKNDKGREGLFGDTMEHDAYQKKTNLAAAISTKEATREPVFDKSAADERKLRELYGNSNYNPIGKEKNHQRAPAQCGMDAELNRNTRGQKAANLASSLLANDDPEQIAKRGQWNNDADKLVSQATGWSAQNNMKKTTNLGGVDAYRQKQNQLGSNVLEQTDYSAFQPMTKKEINTNDFNKVVERIDPRKPVTDINYDRERVKRNHDPNTAKQSMLTSAFDEKRDYAPRVVEKDPVASPVKGKYKTQEDKLAFMTTNISTLPGANANSFFHKPQNKGEVVDLILSGMGENMDVKAIKNIANVKHVIEAKVDIDNLKGTCKGTGRLAIRLNQGEDREQIRQNFINQGILVQDFKNQPQKNTEFSAPKW